MLRIGINGFGRIGRAVARLLINGYKKEENIEIVAINSPGSGDLCAHLLKYDSVHGKLSQNVEFNSDLNELKIENSIIKFFSEKKPSNLDWGQMELDVVLECSGKFKDRESLESILNAGAPKIIVSCPIDTADALIVYGVNDKILTQKHKIISACSCTTNCFVPIAAKLHEHFKITGGFVTTVHAYTNDQNLLDSSHKDPKRARASALSIIPTSTGMSKTLQSVLPELANKIDGSALRVPVPNVSMIDFKFTTDTHNVTPEKINAIFQEECANDKSVIGISHLPLVSVDFVGNTKSAVFDTNETRHCSGINRVTAWYDNEIGFSARMVDIAIDAVRR